MHDLIDFLYDFRIEVEYSRLIFKNIFGHVKFSYTDYNFPELLDVSSKLTEQFILKAGGKIEEIEGQTFYFIPERTVVPSAFVQSWEPGPFDENNKFSDK